MNFQGYMMHGEEPNKEMTKAELDSLKAKFMAKLLGLSPEQQAQLLYDFLTAAKADPALEFPDDPSWKEMTLPSLTEQRKEALKYGTPASVMVETFDLIESAKRKDEPLSAVTLRFISFAEKKFPSMASTASSGSSNTMLWVLGGVAVIGLAWHLTRKRGV
jgi:hypothetical protein